MSNLHPGLILLLVGFLALLAPKPLRRFVIGIGPLAALAAFCQLRLGTDLTVSFSDNTYILHYLHVDELSWLFGLVFCMIAAIGWHLCHAQRQSDGGPVFHGLCLRRAGSDLR